MAIVQLLRIEFVKPTILGHFVPGDVVETFIDTDLATGTPATFLGERDGVFVHKNGVLYTDTSAIIVYLDPANVLIQDFNPKICIGTSLLNFSTYTVYPFSFYVPLVNNYSCQVNSPTCNLLVTGIPSVIPATSSADADGSITVTATSSNPIQYKLGSDFSYGDGSAQADGVFSALLPGTYKIYLRDSANCGVNVTASVNVNNSFGTKLRLEYTDLRGRLTQLNITERGYTGDVIEVIGTGEPFTYSLRGEGSRDKFEPILAVETNLNLISTSEEQFISLYTNDRNLYRMEFLKDGDLKLVTKVLPQQYVEEYTSPPYPVTVTGSCGLPDLTTEFLFKSDGEKFYGTIKLIKLIAHCLKTTKLELPIRVACNLYASTMDITAADDPLDQAYCDFEAFYLKDKEPSLANVLRYILEPFGARLVQWDGRWNIIRVEEMAAAYDYRDFDKDGEYVGNGTFNGIIDLDFPSNDGDLLLSNRDHSLELRPGYGAIRAIYDLGLRPNILRNGDFRLNRIFNTVTQSYSETINRENWTLGVGSTPVEESFEELPDDNVAFKMTTTSAGGDAYLQSEEYSVPMGAYNELKLSVRLKVQDPTFYSKVPGFPQFDIKISPNAPYFKVRMVVEYGGLYLKTDGKWTDNYNELVYHRPLSDFDKYIDFEIPAYQHTGTPALTDTMLSVKLFHAYVYHAQFTSLASLKAFQTIQGVDKVVQEGYKTELSTSTGTMSWFTLEESTDTPDDYNIIRPNDYHATSNPRQWLRQRDYPATYSVAYPLTNSVMKNTMCVDKIVLKFLTSGKDPLDAVVRTVKAEAQNKEILEKELFLGSFTTLLTTENRSSDIFNFQVFSRVTNILPAETIYAGWLRDSSGTGYERWARDGVSESDLLHGILLKSYALQYRKSWRLLRGSVYTKEPFGLLNVIRNVNDSNRIYLPMGITVEDRSCQMNGEFLELIPIGGTSDGSGTSPFGSAFSSAFGSAFD